MATAIRYFGFYKLTAWKEAHVLTVMIYRSTAQFPKHELFGITSQLRRASSSIGAQLAEGSRMSTAAHKKSYYDRAYASAAEVASFLELAKSLGYLPEKEFLLLMRKLNDVAALVYRLACSCK